MTTPAAPFGEGEEDARAARAGRRLAVRMGLRFVKGMGEAEGRRWMSARAAGPMASVGDVSRRAWFDERRLTSLAEAGGFEAFGLTRRAALWEIPGEIQERNLPLPLSADEDAPSFVPLDASETIAWDYRASAHSVRGHPIGPLRPLLTANGLPDARTVHTLASGTHVRYAGLVICRQRPPTAENVTFMTLEDETGFVNLVLWDRVFQAHAVVAKMATWLGVTGTVESKQGVVHVIADALWVPRETLRTTPGRSRDFR
jgi:error-prone DNA polymerase